MRILQTYPLLLLSLCICAVSTLSICVHATSHHTTKPRRRTHRITTLRAQINAFISQPRFAHASWGIDVVSLDSGRTLYRHHAQQLLLPASNAKLYIAALALDTMGANYRIPTRLLGNGALHQGKLDGDLILQGMGDPTLGTKFANKNWAEQLSAALVTHGVQQIDGDLVADDSYFIGPSFGKGWEADDLQSWYAAPASALSLNENILGISIQPARHAGHLAVLRFTPATDKPPLVNTLITSHPHTPDDINLYRPPGDKTLHVFGHIPLGMKMKRYWLSVPDPALLAANELRRALLAHGIKLGGHVRELHWPHNDRKLLAHTKILGEVLSPPLIEVLTEGLKRSENLYLHNLLQIVGVKTRATATAAQKKDFHSSADWGLMALRQEVQKIGIKPSSVTLEEGTGMSRKDLSTPAALMQLLQYLATRPYAKKLYDALPIAHVDGSLRLRMGHSRAAGNVHAKTGEMTFVQCLSGYLTTASGEHLAFVIMLNNYQQPEGTALHRYEVDSIANILAKQRGKKTTLHFKWKTKARRSSS